MQLLQRKDFHLLSFSFLYGALIQSLVTDATFYVFMNILIVFRILKIIIYQRIISLNLLINIYLSECC